MNAAERWLAKAPPVGWPEINRPFGVEADGAQWIVATNGHVAIGERTDQTVSPFESEKGRRTLADCMTPRGEPVGEFSRTELAAFAGSPKYAHRGECPDCYGSGSHNCDCEHCDARCDACGGAGERDAQPKERAGWIGPHVFNLVYLAQLMAEVPDGHVRLSVAGWVDGAQDGGRLWLDGGGWRANIIGLRHSELFGDYDAAPRLPADRALLSRATGES